MVSDKSKKLVEKQFIRSFNRCLARLNLTKHPNQRIEYNQYIEILAYFIFHADD